MRIKALRQLAPYFFPLEGNLFLERELTRHRARFRFLRSCADDAQIGGKTSAAQNTERRQQDVRALVGDQPPAEHQIPISGNAGKFTKDEVIIRIPDND